jgi:hypothetical protein
MSTNVLLLNAILEETAFLRNNVNRGETSQTSTFAYPWNANPCDTALWAQIPRLTGGTSFNVCDTSGYYRCNASCTWTVPAGATIAQFQLWGSGSGTSPGCCCSGSPFGDTGSYTTAIMPVTAGQQYVLCSGCAYCCCAYSGGGHNSASGQPSYVTGPGITTLCAVGAVAGGLGQIYCTIVDLWQLGAHGCCRWAAAGQTSAGSCICNNGSYCFTSSCGTCGIIPIQVVGGLTTPRQGVATITCGFATTLPSFHGGGCNSGDHYGYHTSPPVISETHGVFTGSDCCASYTSGSCCGGWNCSAVNGYRQHPGSGGAHNHMMGGSAEGYGDQGRMGMVRVTYC